MLVLPLDEAEPGARLAAGIWHPEHPEQELLKAGFVLDQTVLHRLRQLGVASIYVDYPDLSELDKHLIPALSPERQRIYQQIKRTIAAVERTAKPSVTFPDYYVATRQLVITLLSQGPHAIYMEHLASRLPTDEISHATAVAHLSLMLGIRLEQYLIRQRSRLDPAHAKEVVNLGIAGMLHDIGKARLDPASRAACGIDRPDDPEIAEAYETHPQLGYDMVRGGIESSAAGAILQHHQHYDGSGFPRLITKRAPDEPLHGEQIHVFARIVALANRFDRLATDPTTGRRRENIETLALLTRDHADQLDPVVLKILPSVVPPFPPGSKLKLSDDTHAVVIGVDPADPYAPSLRRLIRDDSGVARVDGTPFKVSDKPELQIESINGVDVEAHRAPVGVA